LGKKKSLSRLFRREGESRSVFSSYRQLLKMTGLKAEVILEERKYLKPMTELAEACFFVFLFFFKHLLFLL
jgi:hypothetical protein